LIPSAHSPISVVRAYADDWEEHFFRKSRAPSVLLASHSVAAESICTEKRERTENNMKMRLAEKVRIIILK
jgi:hypothetical protein